MKKSILYLCINICCLTQLLAQTYTPVPAKIEAETYTAMNGVVKENCSEGGQNVGYIDNGDWMEYRINPSASGAWTIYFRVATPSSTAQFQVYTGATLLGTVNVPNTGDFQVFHSVTMQVNLTAGQQTIRLVSTGTTGWNFNWLQFAQGTANQPPSANAGGNQTIFLQSNNVNLFGSGSDPEGPVTFAWSKVSGPVGETILNSTSATVSITGLSQGTYVYRLTVTDNGGLTTVNDATVTVNPASPVFKVQAENYTAMNGVETEKAQGDATGGYRNVGWIDLGDWMDYSINVATAGTYAVTFRIATNLSNAQFQIRKPDGTVLGTVNVPNTGGFQYAGWQTTSPVNISLAAGQQTIRLYSTKADRWNINWMEFTTPTSSLPPVVNAGTDQILAYPSNSTTLTGSASDPDGTIASYAWSKVSGPAGETISTPSAASTTVTGLSAGLYTFRLTVTDNSGLTATDDVEVFVSGPSWTLAGNSGVTSSQFLGTINNAPLILKTAGVNRLKITEEGKIGINTGENILADDAQLTVNGQIRATKIKVTQNLWADYVFESSYKLRSLEEVRSFIQRYKHLPDMPSSSQVIEEGLSLGDNQALLLQKIEELTLYVIKQNEELKKQEKQLKKQAAEINALKKKHHAKQKK